MEELRTPHNRKAIGRAREHIASCGVSSGNKRLDQTQRENQSVAASGETTSISEHGAAAKFKGEPIEIHGNNDENF